MSAPAPKTSPVYRPRKPHLTPLYQCVQDHYETLEQVYQERFEKRYGFWRPYLKEVMVRYLECGDYHQGFARVRCQGCGHEYLLAYSCKRRQFCPSCHHKRCLQFGQWLCREVLRAVPHKHIIMSLPKILRRYFLYDRRLLAELSRQGWETLKLFYQAFAPDAGAMPAAVVAVQTFGSFPDKFHPHLHIICADGHFSEDGTFRKAPKFKGVGLEKIFRHKVLKMLLARGKITGELIELMAGWRHSGFNVYCGPRIWPRQKRAMENLALYIVRASFTWAAHGI